MTFLKDGQFPKDILQKRLALKGTVFSSNEYVLIDSPLSTQGEVSMFRLYSFCSVSFPIRPTKIFAKGMVSKFTKNDSGAVETNFWTGFGHIPKVNNTFTQLVDTERFLPKVIVFQGRNPEILVVADFERKEQHLHYHVSVPLELRKTIWFWCKVKRKVNFGMLK